MHGLHDTRGEYTEVEQITVAPGSTFKVETATAMGGAELHVVITTMSMPNTTAAARLGTAPAAAATAPTQYATVALGVPGAFWPRYCDAATVAIGLKGVLTLTAVCPGFAPVTVTGANGAMYGTRFRHNNCTPACH
jgi:hypothetical protein